MKFLSLILILFVLFIGCSKDENSPNDNEISQSFFRISKSVITTDHNSDSYTVEINTNLTWEIQSQPEWLSVSPNKGNTDATLTISISGNNEETERSGTVKFLVQNNATELKITQSGLEESSDTSPITLISHSDSSIEMDEPLFMLFNKPIELAYIGSGDENRIYDFDLSEIEYFDNNHGVKFPPVGGELGREANYSFVVKDNSGRTFQNTINVKYYSQRIEVPALIRKAILDDQGNLWVIALKTFSGGAPSRMYKFREMAGEFVEELQFDIDLDYSSVGYTGGDFFINPYNDFIYIPDYADDQVEVYSKTGTLIKKINIQPVETDHPQNPRLSPVSIGFLKSGKGLLTLQGKGISGRRWRYIDSANDDVLIAPPSSHPNIYTELHTYTLNLDKSKLYSIESRSPIIKVFDGTESFDEINIYEFYPERGDAVDLVQNRNNDKIYAPGLYNQQIITPDGSYLSKQSFSQSFTGDFSYSTEHENFIYGLTHEDTWFQLRDYDNAENVLQYKVSNKFSKAHRRGIVTTPDDKFVIIYSDFVDGSSQSSQIVFFKTEMFK